MAVDSLPRIVPSTGSRSANAVLAAPDGQRQQSPSENFKDDRTPALAARFWNWYAKVYGSVENLTPHKTMLADVVNRIPETAQKILDVGCGSGALLQRIRAERPNAELNGVDFSSEMLARAESRVSRLATQQADLDKGLDFPDQEFDCIVSTNAVYAVTNPKHVVAEMLRVLRPGGTAIISTPKQKAKGALILKRHLREVSFAQGVLDMARFSTCVVPNVLIERLAKQRDYHFFTEQQVREFSDQVAIHDDTFADQNWLFSIHKEA